MKYLLSLCLFFAYCTLISCDQKMVHDGSFNNTSLGTAVGTLKDDNNSCLPAAVKGTFSTGTVNSDAYLEISVNVASPGSYLITTNTVNGVFFYAKGVFYQKGIQKVQLTGKGDFQAGGTFPFTYTFNDMSCTLDVPVAGTPANPGNGNGNGGDGDIVSGSWSVTIAGVKYSGTKFQLTKSTAPNTYTFSFFTDDLAYMGGFLLPAPGGKPAAGTYRTTDNVYTIFSWMKMSSMDNTIGAGVSSGLVEIRITAVNGNKVEGTYSGTAVNMNGDDVKVADGNFKMN